MTMNDSTDRFEPLASIIDRGTYRLTRLRRLGNVALYERFNRDLDRVSSFEVVRIRRAPAGEVFGRLLPAREVYPSTSEWGQYGWTYQHEVNAVRKFEVLVAAQGEVEDGLVHDTDAVDDALEPLAEAA